jgi:hypothetical protein
LPKNLASRQTKDQNRHFDRQKTPDNMAKNEKKPVTAAVEEMEISPSEISR